jgi:hypothetical protein
MATLDRRIADLLTLRDDLGHLRVEGARRPRDQGASGRCVCYLVTAYRDDGSVAIERQEADALVCYCFRYTLGAIQQGDETERAAILADIVEGTRQGQCACTLRNPHGSCCLGNVRRLMRVDAPTIRP